MLNRIKTFFARDRGLSREQVAALIRLPPEERLARLGIVLHEVCVKSATRFVEEEHRRADSPFRNLVKTELFHEVLVMNFWVLAWLFKGRHQHLQAQVHRHYTISFVWGRESSGRELLDTMRAKFQDYDKAWDDYSGHQDRFARQAIVIIFGGRQIAAAPQAAFWLISYADRTMKDFARIGKSVSRIMGEKAG